MVTAYLLSQDPEIKDCVPYFYGSHASWNVEEKHRKYFKMITVERLGETGSREHER